MRWGLAVTLLCACSFDGAPPATSDGGQRGIDAAPPDAIVPDAPPSANAFRRTVRIDPGMLITVDQDSVAVPIRLSVDAHLMANAEPNGSDLLVTIADSGQALPLDFEILDPAAGELLAWVVVPKVAAGTTTDLYLYYGVGNDAMRGPENPWQPLADAVWHFESIAAGPTLTDHSPSGHDGTTNGNGSLALVDGIYGQAYDFSDSVVLMDNTSDLDRDNNDSFSISLWFNQQGTNGDSDSVFYNGGTTTSNAGYELPFGTFNWRANVRDDDGDQARLIFGTNNDLGGQGWHHLVLVVDRNDNNAYAYLNGVLADTDSMDGVDDLRSGGEAARVGGVNQPPDGLIDEFRSYPSALPAEYIALDHAMGRDPATIVTISAPEPVVFPAP